jgi:hypothetical protein
MIDLTGQKFGKLIVLKRMDNNKWGNPRWLCLCDCKKETIVNSSDIRDGHTKSCGCLVTKHGQKIGGKTSPIYITWYHMIDRCTNPNHKYYHSYGGRGITVCERWKIFSNFHKDMGEVPKGLQIDRIDNDKGYYKENCRWATPKQNSRNRRSNKMITYNGVTKSLVEWSEDIGISCDTIGCRLKRNWSIAKALTTPVNKTTKNNKRSKYQTIICEYCGKLFTKQNKRINQTNKKNKKHACSRKCASALINESRKCEPITSNAINTRKDKRKFPEKVVARSKVRQAVKTGKLIPLEECELCGSEINIQAHHPDHSRPFLLLYLCPDCHQQADDDIDKCANLATDYSGCII